VARILSSNQIGAGENGKSAERNVGEVADRGRYQIETRRKLPLHFFGERGFNALNQPPRCVLVVLAMILHACAYSSGRLPVNCLKCGLERRYA
jgi:hypothetical protein